MHGQKTAFSSIRSRIAPPSRRCAPGHACWTASATTARLPSTPPDTAPADVLGVDISEEALEVARENAARNGLNVRFEAHNCFDLLRELYGRGGEVRSGHPRSAGVHQIAAGCAERPAGVQGDQPARVEADKAGRVFGDVFVFAARFHGDVSGHGQSGGAGREAARAHGGIPHAGLRSSHPARRSGNEVPEVHDSFRSCRPGRQCRRPVRWCHGDARPPHEQGAGALRFVSDGVAAEQTTAGSGAGACRLRRHALGDAALPRRGKGRCQCAGLTLFAPLGQKRFRVARLILVCRGREQGVGALCPSGTVGRRAGGRGKGRGVLQFYASAKANVPPLPHALFFPAIPQGERRALPRTRSRDPSLENPFLGNRPPFFPRPHPTFLKTAAGGRLLLLSLPPSIPATAH